MIGQRPHPLERSAFSTPISLRNRVGKFDAREEPHASGRLENYALRDEDANEATSLTRDEFEDKVEESGIRVQLIGRRSRR
jgi:hypothetical protein